MGARKKNADANTARVSGQIEATEVQVAPEAGGRILDMPINEGDRVKQGDLVAQLDTRDIQLALQRAQAERNQAEAQLRLLQAGSRPEDIRQAEAQMASAAADVIGRAGRLRRGGNRSSTIRAAAPEQLRITKAARRRRDAPRPRERSRRVGACARACGGEGVARLQSGARPQEIDAARARVQGVDAQIATLEKQKQDATVRAPVGGVVSERLRNRGEMAAPRTPLAVITDLDRAWAEVFVDEPQVPRIKLGQPATLITDAGDRLPGESQFHFFEGRVHSTQCADRGGSIEARVPREDFHR